MNSNGDELHPNWRALATLHIPLKRFVPAGLIQYHNNAECSNNKNNLLNHNLTGEKVKEFYEATTKVQDNKQHYPKQSNYKHVRSKNNVLQKTPFEKSTFFRAAMNNDLATLKQMHIDKSTDINATDNYGWTALMMAACEGAQETVGFLLKLGADKSVCDKSGKTAQDLAERKAHTHIVNLLKGQEDRCQLKSEVKQVTTIKCPPFYCDSCQQTFSDISQKEHYTSTIHRFCYKSEPPTHALQKFNITPRNRGLKLMKKQGWNCESGLGPNHSGRLYPIKTVIRKIRTGLGIEQRPARVTHFHAFDLSATKSQKWHKPRTRNDMKREKLREWKKERRLRKELS